MRTRQQIYPAVTPALRKRLALYASKKGTSYSSVVESALTQYLDAETTDRALLLRRMDRLGRDLAAVERDVDVLSHAFGLFLQMWFAHTPSIPDEMKRTAEQTARDRYERFLDHLTVEITKSESFVRRMAGESARIEDPSDDGSRTP